MPKTGFPELSSVSLAAVVMLVSAAAQAAPPQAGHANRLIVQSRAGVTGAELNVLFGGHRGKARKLGQSALHVVEFPNDIAAQAVLKRLENHPKLKFAELDKRVKATFVPNDPYFGSQWHLDKVGAPRAWDLTKGAGVTIAILDSGVDPTHPDLAGNLVAGYNFYDNNTNTSDVYGHGTAVAGVAAAATDNATGVAGIAGQAKIMPIRVAGTDGYAYYSTIASGLTYAADHGARIANVSFAGVMDSSTIISAAQYMQSKGGLVFASAGNDNTNNANGMTTTLISVSATDFNDNRSWFSSFGTGVKLSAPGNTWTTSRGGSYNEWQGTSFSSPLAAGVGALVMAANPSLDNMTVQNILFSTAADIGAAGRDDYFGYGRVDAFAAVQKALMTSPPADTIAPKVSITSPAASSTVVGIVPVNVSASDNVGVASVDLVVNGTVVATDSALPFAFSWDSAGTPNGMAKLTAYAYDAAGNVGASTAVSVNVANNVPAPVKDTIAPSVAINNPVAGMVSGKVLINTSASDNAGAAGISQYIYVDSKLVATGKGGALSYNWNTQKERAGVHTVQVVAKDAAGNASSAVVQVSR